MRILKDFKIPDFKFKKIEMNDIPNVEDVKVDYSKVMEAQEKKNKKHQPYPATDYKTVKEIFIHSMKNYADETLILQKPNHKEPYKEYTYKKFGEDVVDLGSKLIKMLPKNSRVVIVSETTYDWYVSYMTMLCGVGIAVPIDKELPENEIENVLKRSKASAVIFSKKKEEVIKRVAPNLPDVKYFIEMNSDSSLEDRFVGIEHLIEEGKTLVKNGDDSYMKIEIDPDEFKVLLFTSGTTSKSKAVMLSHRNIASNISAMNRVEHFLSTDVNMAFLPFHHTFGSTGILIFLNHGCTNVFCDGIRHIQANMKEYKVSIFVCVPLLIESMYKKIDKEIKKQGKDKLIKFVTPISNFLLKFGIDIRRKVFKSVIDNLGGALRAIISGASGLDPKVAKAFNDFGILTIQGYGLTETSPVLAAENENCIRYGSIGFPMPGVTLKVDNQNEQGIGELIAKGPNVMLGYYENEEATNEAIKDGWFHTGDLAKQDKDGYFFITGRKKNVIVLKNGKNIYPEELETLVGKLPYVDECMVFGYPKDDDLVISVKIVYNKDYVKDNFAGFTQEQLKEKIWEDIKEINSGLTNYKHMKKLIITDEPMIKTSTAKIKRHEEMSKILAEEGAIK